MLRPELGAQGSLWPSLTALYVPDLDVVYRVVYSFSGYLLCVHYVPGPGQKKGFSVVDSFIPQIIIIQYLLKLNAQVLC